ncbi:MAG: manganese efflux pump [Candidatus Levybacteria bacterium]|nr:manganese efflux pump [Candidatus Levybacteria bacterium]
MSSFVQVLIISISLALDAVSVSIAEGIEVKEEKIKHALRVALAFGGAQAIMPLIGWVVGSSIKSVVALYAPWIAMLLLVGIGVFMLKEAASTRKKKGKKRVLSHKTLFLLAIATSIDAFTVGITLGLINVPLLLSVGMIGIVTFALCLPAFLFGFHLNKHFEGKLDAIGGTALILLGLKVFFEHIY